MERRSEDSHSTPIPNEQKTERSGSIQKQIQINLSKEYFASLVNSDDVAYESGDNLAATRQDIERHASKESDDESGITPIVHDESPIKGIIKLSESPRKEEAGIKVVRNSPLKKVGSPGGQSPKSQKKVRITEPGKDSSSKAAQSITEIEGIRTQLKHMIDLTKLQNKSGNPYPNSEDNTLEHPVSYQGDTSQTFEEAKRSIDSMTSLRGLLPYSSPPLLMDEYGIIRGLDTEQILRADRTTPEYVSPPNDRSVMFENSILKENLERERQRRKHCEAQIQNLQKKVLEMQQQLAVAIATDKKKAIMIEQLDKTLANIVAGWKKQDSEKVKTIQKLREENSILRKSQNKQQELLEQFEKELAQAVESLTKEQAKAKSAEREKRDEVKRYQELREEAYKKLQHEQEALQKMSEDREQLINEKGELNKQINDLEEQVEEDRNSWIKERQTLAEAAREAEERFQEEIEKLKATVFSAQTELQSSTAKASSLENDVKDLQLDLEDAMREKESLKIEVTLLETKIDAIKSKRESEQRAVLEEEFNKKINIIQEEIQKTESQLKRTHKEQILELNQHHKDDLELQLRRFHEEINKRENQTEMLKRDFETRLSEAEEEMQELRESKTKLEAQRKELTRRLQSLMQQHIQEAVSLINVDGGTQTPFSQQPTGSIGQYVFKDNMIMHPFNMGKLSGTSPLSSTVTEPTEEATLRGSTSGIQSKAYHPSMEPSRLHGGISTTARGMQEQESLAALFESGGNSKLDRWFGASSIGLEQRDLVDSFSLREQQFQSGLQSLSDKLRLTRNGFDGNQEALEQKPELHDGNQRHGKKEKETEELDNWHQIQQLLNDRLDEVAPEEESRAQTESRTRGHPTDQHTGTPTINTSSNEELDTEESRQTKLTSLIKKLLNKSPGNPTDDDDDDYEERSEIPPHRSEIQIARQVDRNIHAMRLANQQQEMQLKSLPVGSDSVSKDLAKAVLKTPTQAPRTSSLGFAFKKSVLKEKPLKPSPASGMNTASSKRRNQDETVEASSQHAREQQHWQGFLNALGLEKEMPKEDLREIIQLFSAFQMSQSQKKQAGKSAAEIPDVARPSKSSLAKQRPKSNSQWHQKERSHVDEIFSRLQKIYGQSEGANGEKIPPADTETKGGSKSFAPSKRQSYPATKPGQKGKHQRKTVTSAKQSLSAWK